MKKSGIIGMVAVGLLTFVAQPEDAEATYFFKSLQWDGFTHHISIASRGEFDLTAANPDVPNCAGGVCATQWYFEEKLGLSQEEIDERRDEAIDIFVEQFGIDPSDPAYAGRLNFFPFATDPRMDWRAFTWGRFHVPDRGWEVFDGGHIFIVTDPNGIEVTDGIYAGITIPPGGAALSGSYLVEAETSWGAHLADIEITYAPLGPANFSSDPRFASVGTCQATSVTINGWYEPAWVAGGGYMTPTLTFQPGSAPNLSKAVYRNTMTFSQNGGFGD